MGSDMNGDRDLLRIMITLRRCANWINRHTTEKEAMYKALSILGVFIVAGLFFWVFVLFLPSYTDNSNRLQDFANWSIILGLFTACISVILIYKTYQSQREELRQTSQALKTQNDLTREQFALLEKQHRSAERTHIFNVIRQDIDKFGDDIQKMVNCDVTTFQYAQILYRNYNPSSFQKNQENSTVVYRNIFSDFLAECSKEERYFADQESPYLISEQRANIRNYIESDNDIKLYFIRLYSALFNDILNKFHSILININTHYKLKVLHDIDRSLLFNQLNLNATENGVTFFMVASFFDLDKAEKKAYYSYQGTSIITEELLNIETLYNWNDIDEACRLWFDISCINKEVE